MFGFGKNRKNNINNDFDDIGDRLNKNADNIIRSGTISRPGIEYVKMSIEYSILDVKQYVDRVDLIIERMGKIAEVMQNELKDKKLEGEKGGKIAIDIFEKLPDNIKKMKILRENRYSEYLEIKDDGEKLIKSYDELLKKIDANKLGEKKV